MDLYTNSHKLGAIWCNPERREMRVLHAPPRNACEMLAHPKALLSNRTAALHQRSALLRYVVDI